MTSQGEKRNQGGLPDSERPLAQEPPPSPLPAQGNLSDLISSDHTGSQVSESHPVKTSRCQHQEPNWLACQVWLKGRQHTYRIMQNTCRVAAFKQVKWDANQ